jgi:hypothetical protein
MDRKQNDKMVRDCEKNLAEKRQVQNNAGRMHRSRVWIVDDKPAPSFIFIFHFSLWLDDKPAPFIHIHFITPCTLT